MLHNVCVGPLHSGLKMKSYVHSEASVLYSSATLGLAIVSKLNGNVRYT